MVDKEQVMIDGCNVSKCRYYLHNLYKSCGEGLVDCEGKDCIFKQLARKEQECEELKNEYWKLEQDNDFLAEKNSRLKGCLAEIKEIAEPFCNACQEFEPEKKGSNCMYCNYGIILRKISEVEKWQIKNR